MKAALAPLVSLALLAGACSSPAKPAPAAPAPAAADAPAETAAETAEAKPDREAMLAATLARATEIQDDVAKIRELKFAKVVPSEYQSNEDFRSFVEREIKKELPPEKNAKLSKAIWHIGLIKTKLDLAATFTDAFASQAAAYYDPATKKFFVVSLSDDQSWLDMMASHELTHALQDQHFNLPAYYGETKDKAGKAVPSNLSEDQLNARRFIVEGEATFIMLVHAGLSQKVNLLDDDKRKMLGMQLRMMGNLSAGQLAKMEMARAATVKDPEMKAQIEAMGKIPPYILVPMLESYTKGTLPIFAAYEAGGWKAVGELYNNPPDSTEQVLHPFEKLVKKRDYPVAVTLPKSTVSKKGGVSEVHTDVLGELSWRVYFETWEVDKPSEAAAGWDGDRYDVIEVPGGKMFARHVTVWDSEDDAKEFETAFLASLTKRFPSGKAKSNSGTTLHARDGNNLVHVKRVKNRVYIVDGANEPHGRAELKTLQRRAKVVRDKRDK